MTYHKKQNTTTMIKMKYLMMFVFAVLITSAGFAQVRPVKKAASAATKVATAPAKKAVDKATDVGERVGDKALPGKENAKVKANENEKFNRGDERTVGKEGKDVQGGKDRKIGKDNGGEAPKEDGKPLLKKDDKAREKKG